MPEATTTTVAHHAILLRQAGDGFYLTGSGIAILLILFVGLCGTIAMANIKKP